MKIVGEGKIMYYVITWTKKETEFPTIVGMYSDKAEANDHFNELQVSGEFDEIDILEPCEDIGF